MAITWKPRHLSGRSELWHGLDAGELVAVVSFDYAEPRWRWTVRAGGQRLDVSPRTRRRAILAAEEGLARQSAEAEVDRRSRVMAGPWAPYRVGHDDGPTAA